MSKIRFAAMAVAVASALSAPAAFGETVKIAFIDPLSGPFAPVGVGILHSWQLVADIANKKNWAGGPKFQIVPFDNKGSPQESVTVLKQVIDQDIHYVVQGNGSGAAIALSDAIQKHNDRNPGKEIVYLNYAAVDPVLTNERCSFWHFRLDVNADMKMEALSSYLAKNTAVKKVYLIGQDYSFGRAVAAAAKRDIPRKRADVQIVGDDLHPIGQVKDFSPYIAKMKAAGADTVVTGNWGADLALLIKAAKDAGYDANFYTFYAGTTGVPTAMGSSGVDKVHIVANWIVNVPPNFRGGDLQEAQLKKWGDDYYTFQTYVGIQLLSEAMKKTKSTDPVKVAFAMEGMRVPSLNGEIDMRTSDHQLQQNVYIATWSKKDGKAVKYDSEKTGYGWKLESMLPSYVAAQPTSCQMRRPDRP